MSATYDETILNVPPPELRFVPTRDLLPHEEHDPQRSAPLIKRIAAAEVWLHPPIVTPLPDDPSKYIVLDGANRCFSVQQLGYPHILVQVVHYDTPQVQLNTWNHAVEGLALNDIISHIRKLDHVDMRVGDLLEAQAELAQRDAIAYIIDLQDESHPAYILCSDERTMATRTRRLRDIVDCYKNDARLERINSSDTEPVLDLYPHATALVVFPRYEPAELLFAAREQILLPPGISRHIIHGRAMRLLYPIETLKDEATSLDAKNAALQNWLQERLERRAVRFYAEACYMFDD